MVEEPSVKIRRFHPADQDAVKTLILAGLQEHWGALDTTKNPDLDDIAAAYKGATFLVAWCGERVVGTGALIPKSETTAEIARMSVAADMRRYGIGTELLHRLCACAWDQGIRRIVLETTETWQDVIAFYLRFGFRITHYQEGDVYFALDL
ncbi:MAG: GNAT family N-acetyltransferase [Anaerolineae bacterium]|nr:GNAT family N-acetyltransferase [Anaerolineae bacterium]